MENYNLDALFSSLALKEFDTVVFAQRKENALVNGKMQERTVGTKLKERVKEKLPCVEPDFISGLIKEAAGKYNSLSWEEKVAVGFLTSIGAEEFAKSSQTEYFEVPSGMDFVGIAAEGMVDEKATLAAREDLTSLGLEKDFAIYRDVRIKSGKFGSLCGSGSSHLLLEGEEAGFGVFEHAFDCTGYFGKVGEYPGKKSKKTHILVKGNAGSGFMAESENGHGTVDGNADGSAGVGAVDLALHVEGNAGDLLLANSTRSLAYVGTAGNYAAYKAQKPLIFAKKAGKLLGDGMVEGNILVKEIDTYAEPGKLLGSGTGKVAVSKQEYANMLLKENKPGYTIEVNEKFFGSGCESCSCGSGGACAKRQ